MPAHSRNKDELDQRGPTNAGEWMIVTVSGHGSGHVVANALLELGGSSVQETPDGGWATWLRLAEQPASAERHVREKLGMRFGDSLRIACSIAPDEDWLRGWRQGLGPRRIGDRVVVAPSWAVAAVESQELLVELDPEMAFGTGEHGSTRTAIRLLANTARAGKKVLDVGAGSGILSIVAAKLGADVLAVEADAEAVRTAESNLRRNGVDTRVRVVHLRITRGVLDLLHGVAFDLIVANVERSFTEPLLSAFASLMNEGGELIVAGILEEEAVAVRHAARLVGLEVADMSTDEGWWAGVFTLVAAEA
jgi:ribosomal protein L11 methyltransferase